MEGFNYSLWKQYCEEWMRALMWDCAYCCYYVPVATTYNKPLIVIPPLSVAPPTYWFILFSFSFSHFAPLQINELNNSLHKTHTAVTITMNYILWTYYRVYLSLKKHTMSLLIPVLCNTMPNRRLFLLTTIKCLLVTFDVMKFCQCSRTHLLSRQVTSAQVCEGPLL